MRRGRDELTSEYGWSAGARGRRWARRKPRLELRDEVETLSLDGQRDMSVSRCVGKAVEGQAVAAREAVMCGWGRVVSMRDIRDGAERERQQQSREGNSQPLRRSSGQMHQAHERQRMTGERNIGYGEATQL